MPEPTPLDLVAMWDQFFTGHPAYALSIANGWPQQRAVVVAYAEVEQLSEQLAAAVIVRPTEVLDTAATALRNQIPPDAFEAKLRAVVRIRGLPAEFEVQPGAVREEHLGQLVRMPGRVRKVKEVVQKLSVGAFQCLRCGAITEVPSPDLELVEPLECSESQGGCGRRASSTRWRLVQEQGSVSLDGLEAPQLSVFRDMQMLHLEEHYDPESGQEPGTRRVVLWDDLVGPPRTPDVIVTGIAKARPVRKGNAKMATFETYIDAVYIEAEESDQTLVVGPEEEAEVKKLASLPVDVLMSKLVRSYAPTIYGMEWVKEALLLQQFGGVQTKMPDGTMLRGDSHILLVGGPGIAKSQLLKFSAKVAPIGRYGSGTGSSGVGLTVSAEHDELDGAWVLKYGLLPLCHKGLACIDEIARMSEEDTDHLHDALEQQEIPYAKAGMTGSVRAQISLLAAANPVNGVFDPNTPLLDQVALSRRENRAETMKDMVLLSRFDLVYILQDLPNAEQDRALAGHIFEARSGSSDLAAFTPEISPRALRRYIAYAKQNITPKLTAEIKALVVEKYVALRSVESRYLAVTPRQFEGLLRLSQACARARLSQVVELKDIDRAFVVFDHKARLIATDENGKIDITVIATGRSRSQDERIKTLRQVVVDLSQHEPVDLPVVVEHMVANHGASEAQVRADIETLIRHGVAYEPAKGKLKGMK